MRAIALLSISALCACGRVENVSLTARLKMSSLTQNWCGSMNPDAIRMDCPFELGLYVTQPSDAGTPRVIQTVCVKVDAQPNRKWSDLPQTLNTAMAGITNIAEGSVRIEMAIVEPVRAESCAYGSSMSNASLVGTSDVLDLMGKDLV